MTKSEKKQAGGSELLLKLRELDDYIFFNLFPDAITFLEQQAAVVPMDSFVELGLIEEFYCLVRHAEMNERATDHAMDAWRLYGLAKPDSAVDLFKVAETCLLLGEYFVKVGQLEVAQNFVTQGLTINPELAALLKLEAQVSALKAQAVKDELEAAIKKAEVVKAELEAEEADAKTKAASKKQQEANRRAAERRAAEDRKAKEAAAKKEEAERKEAAKRKEATNTKAAAGIEAKKGEPEAEEETEAEEEMEATAHKFTDYYTIDMILDQNTWKGTMSNKFGKFVKTFIGHISDINGDFEGLWALCASHEGLLSITTFTTFPFTECPLLITEEVSTFSDYCEQLVSKFLKMPKERKITWWDTIADNFYIIFRDVIVALTFLYTKKNRCCGNLKNNLYVTKTGRARILPAVIVDRVKMKDDVKALVLLMKELLFHPSIDDLGNVLPANLIHCLNFLSNHTRLPLEYLLNHPFFWTLDEMISYPSRLKNILYMPSILAQTCRTQLQQYLSKKQFFTKWEENLKDQGIYYAIWKKGDPIIKLSDRERQILDSLGAIKVAQYNDNLSIVRYFAAVLYHYFDRKYHSLRPLKMSHTDVLEELIQLFPEFYIVMYEALGAKVEDSSIDRGILSELETMVEKPGIFPRFAHIQMSIPPATMRTSSTALKAQPKTATGPVAPPATASPSGEAEDAPVARASVASPSGGPNASHLDLFPQVRGEEKDRAPLSVEEVTELSDRCKILEEHLCSLSTTACIKIAIDASVFNNKENKHIECYLTVVEIRQMFRYLWLNVVMLQAWSSFLYATATKASVAYLCPVQLVDYMHHPSRCAEYISHVLKVQEEMKYIMGAFFEGNHWMLAVICPGLNIVYILDSQRRIQKKLGIKAVIEGAWELYCGRRRSYNTNRKLDFKEISCPQQQGDYECGYFVMKWIYDITFYYSKSRQENFEKNIAKSSMSISDMNQVREVWAASCLANIS